MKYRIYMYDDLLEETSFDFKSCEIYKKYNKRKFYIIIENKIYKSSKFLVYMKERERNLYDSFVLERKNIYSSYFARLT